MKELLDETLSLIKPDEQEEEIKYLLTKDEEEAAVLYEILALQKSLVWKLERRRSTKSEIAQALNEVDWEAKIDKKEILRRANIAKEQAEWHKRRRIEEKEEIIQRRKNLLEVWTAKRMFSLMSYVSREKYGKKLLVKPWNKHLITTICYFLSQDTRFESEFGYSFNRGLLIRGRSGVGKTHTIECVSENEVNSIHVISMLEITDTIRATGEYRIDIEKKKIIYLDDVGTEEADVMYYGSTVSFFKNFIELCYLKNKSYGGLIVSTNCSFDEIERKYGFRVRSRMKDMFNVVDVKGEDLRGQSPQL